MDIVIVKSCTFYNLPLTYILISGNNGNIVWISGIRVLQGLLSSDGRDYGPADSLGKEKACIARSYLNFSSELYDQLHTLLHHVKTVQTDLQVKKVYSFAECKTLFLF